jgi:hypothetical protein
MELGLSSIALFIGAKRTDKFGEINMVTLHPSILEHDGKKAFAVLPYEEFVKIEEELNDFEDLKELRASKMEEANASAVSLASIRKKLDI